MALLREPLLLLSRSGMVKQLVSTMPVSAGIVRSYVPGETTESVVDASAVEIGDVERAREVGHEHPLALGIERDADALHQVRRQDLGRLAMALARL